MGPLLAASIGVAGDAMRSATFEALRKAGLIRVTFRVYEFLKTVDLRTLRRNLRYMGKAAPDGLPVPPLKLVVLVAGTADIQTFLEGGRQAASSIVAALERQGIEIDSLGAVLDFGCGCGRVIRRWHSLADVSVFGTDYSPALVDWCQQNLPFARFGTNQLAPPLAYSDDAFDLIYALSVFTHLTEPLQISWMEELARVLKPGGYLLFTTHGEHYLDMLSEGERDAFEAGNVVVRYDEVAGTNMCSTFHPQSYVRAELTKGLEIVDFLPKGAKGNPYQDLYLLRKPSLLR
jgi:SAM-dependent methyltransferase